MKLKRIAINISTHVFTLHGVDEQERPVVRRNLKRVEMEILLSSRTRTWSWRPAAAPIIGLTC
jgi:hypothetical protein